MQAGCSENQEGKNEGMEEQTQERKQCPKRPSLPEPQEREQAEEEQKFRTAQAIYR
jgi:hypothetical protein